MPPHQGSGAGQAIEVCGLHRSTVIPITNQIFFVVGRVYTREAPYPSKSNKSAHSQNIRGL